MRTVSTIGYEGAGVDAFVYTLGVAGIDLVIDVREIAASRRPGFSKNALRQNLELADIGYIHLRKLGDPKPGREAMRRGDRAEFERVFLQHLTSGEAQEELTEAVELASKQSVALLCYERNPTDCHRTIVAAKMKEQKPFVIRHLGVQSGRRIVDAEVKRIESTTVR